MKNQLPVIAKVDKLGKIVEVCSDFYVELQQLKDSGARLISPRDEAYARLHTRGKENIGQVYGTRTISGFEYAKGRLPIFRVNSRLNDPKLAKLAVEANKARNYFHTESTKEYEESLKQAEKEKSKEPKKRNIMVLPSRDAFTISDKENWDIFEMIFKDQAKPYFEYNGPITVYPIHKGTVDEQDGTILNVLWFRSYEGASLLYGFSRNINHDDRARGVFVEDIENTHGKSKSLSYYQQKQIDKYLQLVQKIKDGKASVSKLEKVEIFLADLKK